MGSGPVIISAKTRRREYSNANTDYQVDGFPSCKHMCCRDGVDKAPKAPKNSFVSAVSLVDSPHLSGHKAKNGRAATAQKPAAPPVPKTQQEMGIETVDLANGQTSRDYEARPPKAFRRLDRLHESVTKGRTAPVAIKNLPSFDYAKGGQPQISFLNQDASAGKASDNPSTNYDADGMGDLPSPSALLGKPLDKADPYPDHTSTEYGSSWSDGLSPPLALIGQTNPASGTYPYNDSLEAFDLSQFNDDGSDLEAAMIGLSDSVTMKEDSQVHAATGQTSSQAEAFTHWSLPPDEPTPKVDHRPTFEAENSDMSKLFLSTNRPEKDTEQRQKRKTAVSDQVEDLSHSAPVPKRPRVSDEHDQAARPSSSAERQAKPAGPILKAGMPAWVYEMDAVLVAEYQDIVDFI